MPEEGVGVGQSLLHGTRNHGFDDRSRIWTARSAKEHLHRGPPIAAAIQFERAWNFGRTRNGHQRGLEKDDGVNDLWCINAIWRDRQPLAE